jgi:glycosyltransferase involved in cell wall biosynthesis
MKVTGFRNGDGGCDFYRCVIPLEKSMELSGITYRELWSEKLMADILLYKEEFKKKMDSDIYLIQRLNTVPFLKRIKQYILDNGINSRIVMDFDDNVFKISPLSGHYKDYGTENVRIKMIDGSEHDLWKDGVNGFDLALNRSRLDNVKEVVSMADMVTVTTPILAGVFREFNDNVRILPNCVDLNEWKKLPLEKNDSSIRLYWGGGMSHWEDLLLIRDTLKRICEKYENVKIVMLGWMPEGFEETFPGRVEFHPWSNFYAYSYKYASLGVDIALIPLVDNEFNRCKSCIKWIEASSLEIPSVVSYVSPYKELESLSDKDLAVFIDGNGPESWFKGISELIDNPELRKRIGAEARNVVERHFDINTQYNQWLNAYSEVLCAPPRQIPPNLN